MEFCFLDDATLGPLRQFGALFCKYGPPQMGGGGGCFGSGLRFKLKCIIPQILSINSTSWHERLGSYSNFSCRVAFGPVARWQHPKAILRGNTPKPFSESFLAHLPQIRKPLFYNSTSFFHYILVDLIFALHRPLVVKIGHLRKCKAFF